MDAERGFELLLLSIAGLVTALLLSQYLNVVLAAVLLAYLLGPPSRRLAPRIGERPAAISLIVATTVLVLVPFVLLVRVVVTGMADIADRVGGDGGLGAVDDLLGQVYGGTFDLEESLLQLVRDGQAGELAAMVLEAIGGVMTAVTSLTILVLLTYALLTEGDALLAWVGSQVPLASSVWQRLLDRADKLLYAVVIGNVVIAVVDGTMVGVGLFIAGFDSVVFWTFMAIFTALIPIVGSMIVWVPAAGYLLATGEYVTGGFLLVYGGIGIGVVDNVLRSYVGAQEAGLNPALFIVGIFSGLALIGPMGLFFGPIALAMAKHVFEVVGETGAAPAGTRAKDTR